MEPIKTISRRRQRPRPRRRRHRPDHPQAVPQADRALGLRRVPLLRLGEGAGLEPAAQPDPDRRAQLRLRLLARARRLGARGLRLPGVVAPSFGDIFYINCAKIGLLPVVLDEADVRALAAAGEGEIDLEAQEVRFAGRACRSTIDAEIRRRLLGGLDDIALTLQQDEMRSPPTRASASAPGPAHHNAL